MNIILLKQKQQRDLKILKTIRSSSYPNEVVRKSLNNFYVKFACVFCSGFVFGVINEVIDYNMKTAFNFIGLTSYIRAIFRNNPLK